MTDCLVRSAWVGFDTPSPHRVTEIIAVGSPPAMQAAARLMGFSGVTGTWDATGEYRWQYLWFTPQGERLEIEDYRNHHITPTHEFWTDKPENPRDADQHKLAGDIFGNPAMRSEVP